MKKGCSKLSIQTCNVRASSNILSISACTSARHVEREFERSMMARLEGLLRSDLFAKEISAITRVIIILQLNFKYKLLYIYMDTDYMCEVVYKLNQIDINT